MWVRSFRALDEWYGIAGGADFEINSFAGRIEILHRMRYRSRPGAESGPNLMDAPRPFDSLERDPPTDYSFITRQRWPLGDTDRWQPNAPLFASLEYKSWLAWARDGPGRFVFVRRLQIPYWLPLVIVLCPLTLMVARRLRGRQKTRNDLCTHCGYDLRATPARCPECGGVSNHRDAAAT
jgi:hypothetical protein